MSRPTIFVDVDGVLADWLTPALSELGYSPAQVLRQWEQLSPRPWNVFDVIDMTPAEGWRRIDAAGAAFWANLPIKPHAHQLINACRELGDTAVLTSPSLHPSSYAGKVQWLDYHFGRGFARNSGFLGSTKWLVARPGAVLIDDHPAHCEEWEARGGKAILFPALGNELYKLADNAFDHIAPQLAKLSGPFDAAKEVFAAEGWEEAKVVRVSQDVYRDGCPSLFDAHVVFNDGHSVHCGPVRADQAAEELRSRLSQDPWEVEC